MIGLGVPIDLDDPNRQRRVGVAEDERRGLPDPNQHVFSSSDAAKHPTKWQNGEVSESSEFLTRKPWPTATGTTAARLKSASMLDTGKSR